MRGIFSQVQDFNGTNFKIVKHYKPHTFQSNWDKSRRYIIHIFFFG